MPVRNTHPLCEVKTKFEVVNNLSTFVFATSQYLISVSAEELILQAGSIVPQTSG